MSIVNYPVLDFKNSLAAFHNFAGEYNQDKPLREQLRPQHSKLFARILTLLARHLYERNKLFNDTPDFRQTDSEKPMMLSVNRKSLSWVEKTIKIDGNSVYRQLLRLMDAGVITDKINHGSRMNFEVLINPEMLLIKDHLNPDYVPVSKYLESGKSANQKVLNTSFPPEQLIPEKELSNNLNIAVDKVSRPVGRDDFLNNLERSGKNIREHRKINTNCSENEKKIHEQSQSLIAGWNNKEHQVAPGRETKLRAYQKGAARWFFRYVMNSLFEGRSFNPAHLENTLDYVESLYFTHCHSMNAVENTRKLYQWRIDKAKRTIARHKTNMQWIFPGHYLNLNHKGTNPESGKPYMSFVNTASWPKKFVQFQKSNREDKKKTTDLDLLNRQIRLYLNNPNLTQFQRCEAYVKKNIPHLRNEFLSRFKPSNTPVCA